MKFRTVAFTAMICCFLFGMLSSQEIILPQRPSDLDFSPREHLQQLAASKAQRLDRQIEYEKRFLPEMATNWQEYDICYYDINWRLDDTSKANYGAVGIYGFPTVPQLDSVMVNLDDALIIIVCAKQIIARFFVMY